MAKQGDQELVVFGAGLMRTGTMSLQAALQILLKAPCYHMSTVFENPSHIPIWEKAATDGLSDDEWRQLFKGYKAAVDMPAAVFYERLSEVYPNAKVILSVREPHGWYRSVLNSIVKLRETLDRFPWNILASITFMRNGRRMITKVENFGNNGFPFPLENEEEAVAFFERHVEKVKRTIPSDRLLVFQASDGWEPLCTFLGLPVPDVPYPKVNASQGFQGNVGKMIGKTTLKSVAYWSIVIGTSAFVAYQLYERRDDLIDFVQKKLLG